MAYKLGLKLWSINTGAYYKEAQRLYAQGIFDYIELYVVPETLDTLPLWKQLHIPYIIHNAHFAHQFNLAKKENEQRNKEIYKQTKQFADELDASYIIFHGGMDGNIQETARQLAAFQEPRALIENKPYRAPLGEKRLCRGYSIEEISQVIKETGCGFCLDIGHAMCTANSLNQEPYHYVEKFNSLNPTVYHLSDNDIHSSLDRHLHIGQGNYDFKKLIFLLPLDTYISIETNKNSLNHLDDFEQDILCLNKLNI